MRSFKDPVLFTNLLFFVNGWLWFVVGQPIVGTLLFCSAFCACVYHLSMENNDTSLALDRIFAHLSLYSSLYCSFNALDLYDYINLFNILTIGLYVKAKGLDKNYDLWHTLWHIFVFLGQLYLVWRVYEFTV